jgi:hypothetical protein
MGRFPDGGLGQAGSRESRDGSAPGSRALRTAVVRLAINERLARGKFESVRYRTRYDSFRHPSGKWGRVCTTWSSTGNAVDAVA